MRMSLRQIKIVYIFVPNLREIYLWVTNALKHYFALFCENSAVRANV